MKPLVLGLAATLLAASGDGPGSAIESIVASAAPAADAAYTYTAAAFHPEYTLPAPGSYRLPVVQRVRDHALVDAGGGKATLFGLKANRLAVVSFVYLACPDATGCPLATLVLHRLDRAIDADPELAGRVALLSVSFDPERDIPERLAQVRAVHAPRSDWRFATAPSAGDLEALLADFDQPVSPLRDENGEWTGLFRHVLKVFLLDEENRVRNVYSTGFFDADLVLGDLKTLARESAPRARAFSH